MLDSYFPIHLRHCYLIQTTVFSNIYFFCFKAFFERLPTSFTTDFINEVLDLFVINLYAISRQQVLVKTIVFFSKNWEKIGSNWQYNCVNHRAIEVVFMNKINKIEATCGCATINNNWRNCAIYKEASILVCIHSDPVTGNTKHINLICIFSICMYSVIRRSKKTLRH